MRRCSPTATLPEHLIVIGGGPIGIELAQAHRGLGAAVTVIDAGPILPRDDPELVGQLTGHLTAEGIALKPDNAVASVEQTGAQIIVTAGKRRAHRGIASAGRGRAPPRPRGAQPAGRRHRQYHHRHRRRCAGCARPTAAPTRSATRLAARNSPMSRSITPASSSATRCSACRPGSITAPCPGSPTPTPNWRRSA